MNNNAGIFAVEIRSWQGIGAKLVWCLEIMAYCDEKGLQPRFRFSYPDSIESEDYFNRFFMSKNSGTKVVPGYIKISDIHDLQLDKNYNDVLTTDLAFTLMEKYLHIRKDVTDEVERFVHDNFREGVTLGVHYRGTDKSAEAPRISYEKVAKNIDHYLYRFPDTDCIFIMSDETAFIDYIGKCRINCRVVYRNDYIRSSNGKAVHHTAGYRYEMNRDAIVNSLILSKCRNVLKTASILSGWSTLLNPEQSLVFLTEPFPGSCWFPERDLLGKALYKPIV